MRAFDEMTLPDGKAREAYGRLARWLKDAPSELLSSRRSQAELLFRRIGITFAVYGDKDATERLIPFDLVPRIFERAEWQRLETGLVQRVKALNLFLADVYGAREILRAGVVPSDLVYRNPAYRPEMVGHKTPHGVYVHIAGIDIVRIDDERIRCKQCEGAVFRPRRPNPISVIQKNCVILIVFGGKVRYLVARFTCLAVELGP